MNDKRATTSDGASEAAVVQEPVTKKARKDKGRRHAWRHGVLSRYVLEALERLGEDPKYFRRLERKFRAGFQPQGELGALLFDRFWSSYLRLVLVARLESSSFGPERSGNARSAPTPLLIEGSVPTLVLPPEKSASSNGAGATGPVLDVFRQLVLVQRYDRHFAREMHRALAMLLLMRKGSEDQLADWIRTILGERKPFFEDKGRDNENE